MDIAIIGAGFSGLAVACHLINHHPAFPQLNIHLFDSKPIGQSTSGIAAGLLHPFVGAHAKLNRMGLEGFESTQELLNIAAQTLGRPVTATNQGILRLALREDQWEDYQRCAEIHPHETQRLDSSACQELAPGCADAPGLWIKQGQTVYSSLYLEGLWQACFLKGAKFVQRTITSLEELKDFDLTIVTTGAETYQLKELENISLSRVKGQVLELEWPEGVPPLTCSLNSHVYILMTENRNACLVGATYERGFQEAIPDVKSAEEAILPKAIELFPPLKNAIVKNCYAGMRAVTPQRLPWIKQLSPKQWLLAGMGSRGLLYHARFARELVERLYTNAKSA